MMKIAAPVKPQSRLEFVDILRGFALLGVLTANLSSFSGYSLNPANYSDFLDGAILVLIQFFVRAKFYSLFSFLFGWGISVQMQSAARKGYNFVPLYLRRMAILLAFGMIHGMLIWSGDILTFYAVMGVLLLLLFRNRSERVLLITAVSLLIFVIILNLPGETMTAFRNWYAEATDFMRWGNQPNSILGTGSASEIIAKTTQNYWSAQSWFVYFIGPVLAMFILGFYVGKRRIFQNVAEHLLLLRRVLIIGLVVGVIFNSIFVWNTLHPEWVGAEYNHIVRIASRTIGAPALMLFYVSGLTLLLRRDWWLERLQPLGNIGRMALSNYLMQSVVCVLIFYGYGLGLYGQTDPSFGLIITILLFTIQLRTSAWHLEKYQFGPMEWLWRTLTYGRRQPWRHRETYENLETNRAMTMVSQLPTIVKFGLIAAVIFLVASGLFLRYRDNLDIDEVTAFVSSQSEATPVATRPVDVADEKQEPNVIVTPQVEAVAYQPGDIAQTGDMVALAQTFDPEQALFQIEILSEEPYNGRRAASEGGLAAGDYLAEQFTQLGLQPAGDDGTFFQTFPVSYTNLAEVPQLSITQANGTIDDSYILHQDYAPIVREFVGAGSGSGEVVWLNQCSHDDFGQLDAYGKIVLCQPEPGYEAAIMANRAALEYGAQGLLLVTDPEQRSADMGDRFLHPWIPEPIPALRVYPKLVADLFADSGISFAEVLALEQPMSLATTVDITVSTLGYDACPPLPPASGCTARNVLGVLPSRDPAFADEVVIIGAHYDHLGDAPAELTPRTIWAGANDDASGTAVLLEIARNWQEQGYVPRRTVLFAAWDAEELGLLGSRYYVENPQYPHENVVAKLQLDMVGAGGDILTVDGTPSLANTLLQTGEGLDIDMAQTDLGSSDHVPFVEAGVPAALLIWLDEEGSLPRDHYHRPADLPEVIDLDKLGAVGELTALTALNLVESEPAILDMLADRETAVSTELNTGVSTNNLAAFLNTSSADQESVDTTWFQDLQAHNPLTVTLTVENLHVKGDLATGNTTIQVTIPLSDSLETITGQLPTQFMRTENGWRWHGPDLIQTAAEDIIVGYPTDVEDDLSAVPTAVRDQYRDIANTLNLPADTPFTLQLFPDEAALRTATSLFMPETQQTWAGPGLVQMVYTKNITETTAPALAQLALANNGITEAETPWLWHGLPFVLEAETNSIAVQSELIPQLHEAFASEQPIPRDAAAWATTDYALRQTGWRGLLSWQETDEWQADWQQRLTAVQADLDTLLAQRTTAILAENERDFLRTAVPNLATAQSRWLTDLEAHPLQSFSQSVIPLAFLDDGSVLAEVTMTYQLEGQGPSTAQMTIRFDPGDDSLLWAGKYLHELDEEITIVGYPEGHRETAVNIQKKANQWIPELASLLNISPTLPIQIELYDAPDDLRAAIALPYHATNWTEPGQAVKLQVTADDGELLNQLTRQLLHQGHITDEWLLRGIPAFISANYDGGLKRHQLSAQWPFLQTAVTENTLLNLEDIQPAINMGQQDNLLADLQSWDAVSYLVQTQGWEKVSSSQFDINQLQQEWATSLAQDHIQSEWVDISANYDGETALAQVDHLASEELAGRLAGTEGAELAAAFIADAFRDTGLQPAGDNRTYFQTLPITTSQVIPTILFEIEANQGETTALSETAVFNYRDDFLPVSPVVAGEPASGNLFYMSKDAEYGDFDFEGGIVVRKPNLSITEEISQAVSHNASALILIGIKNDDADLYGKTPDSALPTAEIPVLELTQDGHTHLLEAFDHDRNSIKKFDPIQPLEAAGKVQYAVTPAQPATTSNILAVWPGSDPLLSDEIVIVGAHYDYVGDDGDWRRYSGRNAASGIATMLEIINLWQKAGYQPKRTVLFAAWGANELGNLGSKFYMENPSLPLTNTVALIQLDNVGGGDGFALGAQGDEAWDGRLLSGIETAVTLLNEKVVPTSRTNQSDHLSFTDANFPTLLLAWRLAGDENMSDDVDHTATPENLTVSGKSAALLLMSLAQ